MLTCIPRSIINAIFGNPKKQKKIRSEKPTKSESSILSLNNDCLSEIFKYLGLSDLINAAGVCSRLHYHANEVFKKKFLEFKIDKKMIRKDHYIKRTLSNIGYHVTALEIEFENHKCSNKILRAIEENCPALQRLKLKGMIATTHLSANFKIYVETLVLDDCDLRLSNLFFDNFYNLKCLHVKLYRDINHELFEKCVRNNPQIEDFALAIDSCTWEYDIVETVNPLIQLNNLTKLKLHCNWQNVNPFLIQLARHDTMEELTLCWVKFNRNSCDILKSFTKLRLLDIHSLRYIADMTNLTLPNLKHFRLSGFECSLSRFISIIKEFTCLENIDLRYCFQIDSELPKIVQEIETAVELNGKRSTLTVSLPTYNAFDADISKKYVYVSSRLRIANNYHVENYGCIHNVFYQKFI